MVAVQRTAIFEEIRVLETRMPLERQRAGGYPEDRQPDLVSARGKVPGRSKWLELPRSAGTSLIWNGGVYDGIALALALGMIAWPNLEAKLPDSGGRRDRLHRSRPGDGRGRAHWPAFWEVPAARRIIEEPFSSAA